MPDVGHFSRRFSPRIEAQHVCLCSLDRSDTDLRYGVSSEIVLTDYLLGANDSLNIVYDISGSYDFIL